MGAKQISSVALVTSPTLLPSPRRTEGSGQSNRTEGERREKAVKPRLETKRKLSSEESTGGHGVEKSRMIWETGGYTGDRAGVIPEIQVRQVYSRSIQPFPAPVFTGATLDLRSATGEGWQ